MEEKKSESLALNLALIFMSTNVIIKSNISSDYVARYNKGWCQYGDI